MHKLALSFGAHSVHQLYAHLVFVTYNRYGLIGPARKKALERHFREICEKKGAELVMFNSDDATKKKRGDDHVHLLVRYPPSLSIAQLVQHLKGESSFRLSRDEEEKRKKQQAAGDTRASEAASDDDLGRFRWSKYYFAKSVGHTSGEQTGTYVKTQGR